MRRTSLNAVDLNLLKVFAAVYGRRNLTHAGQALAMTQPAVSRAVDRLRTVFDDRLFHRVDGEMRPTRMAELLAPSILEGLGRFEAALDFNRQGEQPLPAANLRLGLNDGLSIVVLPPLMKRLDLHWPEAFLSTVAATYQSAPDQVLREEVDCAIVSSVTSNERLATEPLFKDDYVAMTASDHPLNAGHVDLDAYVAYRHLLVSYTGVGTGWVDLELQRLGRTRRVGAVIHLYAAAPELLRAQPLICTIPRQLGTRLAAAYSLRLHELPFDSKCHVFHLVWPRHLTRHPISMALREHVVAACAGLAGLSPKQAL